MRGYSGSGRAAVLAEQGQLHHAADRAVAGVCQQPESGQTRHGKQAA